MPFSGELVDPNKLKQAVAAFAKRASSGSGKGNSSDGKSSSARDIKGMLFNALPASLRKQIASPPYPGEDTSRTAASVFNSLRRRGWTKDEIGQLILSFPEGVGKRYAANKDLAKDIERMGSKWQDDSPVKLDDFQSYMPMHSYIYVPSGEMWPAGSVNARLGTVPLWNADGTPVLNNKMEQVEIPASQWIDKHRPVEQMTWAPGLPALISDRLISEGGWIDRPGVTVFNQYRPPTLQHGDPSEARPWIDHVHKVYPAEADHIIHWFAHRVQHPQEKINHALVLGGSQGIGKDTMIEPVKRAVGPWNCCEVSPTQMLGRFNGYVKSVILRVSEARDLGDMNRYAFYDHMKTYTAAPPDTLRVDEKHIREHHVLNCTGVILTTNHRSDGLYLPADDRRHFVAWSDLTKDDFSADYWSELWAFYEEGGYGHVAAYLATLDITAFNPKAPPPKTDAFWQIVSAGQAPEDAEMADVLAKLGRPYAVGVQQVLNAAEGDFSDFLRDRKNRRVIPHRMEAAQYVPVRNPDSNDGLWVINRKRQAVYGRSELSAAQRLGAARRLGAS
jgi:hypothetical protein